MLERHDPQVWPELALTVNDPWEVIVPIELIGSAVNFELEPAYIHLTADMTRSLKRCLSTTPDFADTSSAASCELPQLSPDSLKECTDDPVGSGGFGIVSLADLPPWNLCNAKRQKLRKECRVAVKRFFQHRRSFQQIGDELKKQVEVVSKLDHPNILDLIGFSLDSIRNEALLVTPYLPSGSICARLRSGMEVSQRQKVDWLSQITEGLKYLHTRRPPLVHGDLKAGNVLIHDRETAVLADFDLTSESAPEASQESPSTEFISGSIRWCSPEVLDGRKRTLSSDIWSWAHLVLEIWTGKLPYYKLKNQFGVIRWIVLYGAPDRADYPELKSLDTLWTFLRKCWRNRPKARPNISKCENVVKYLATVPDHRAPVTAPLEDEGVKMHGHIEELLKMCFTTSDSMSFSAHVFNSNFSSESQSEFSDPSFYGIPWTMLLASNFTAKTHYSQACPPGPYKWISPQSEVTSPRWMEGVCHTGHAQRSPAASGNLAPFHWLSADPR